MNDLAKTLDQFAYDFIGFEDAFRHLKRRSDFPTGSSSFPPYNIIQDGQNIAIELAIAGYNEDELELDYEDGVLTIKGEKNQELDHEKYVYRGIAGRRFERAFNLADTVFVDDAKYENGILTINLHNELPEHKKHRKIELRKSGEQQLLNE